jgi:hypothetical protein
MNKEPNTYYAYMLRLWQTQSKGKPQWRASLENAHTSERLVFAGLEQCFAFLHEKCANQPPKARSQACVDGNGEAETQG